MLVAEFVIMMPTIAMINWSLLYFFHQTFDLFMSAVPSKVLLCSGAHNTQS